VNGRRVAAVDHVWPEDREREEDQSSPQPGVPADAIPVQVPDEECADGCQYNGRADERTFGEISQSGECEKSENRPGPRAKWVDSGIGSSLLDKFRTNEKRDGSDDDGGEENVIFRQR
jgi:hypothetical protein